MIAEAYSQRSIAGSQEETPSNSFWNLLYGVMNQSFLIELLLNASNNSGLAVKA
jgi:hypothetical protein